MSGHHFEAKNYALRKSKDGVIVSFVVHPNDVTPELLNLPVGAQLMIGWKEFTEGGEANKRGTASSVEKSAPDLHGAGGGNIAQPQDVATPGARPKRAFKDLSLPEQAGIRCEDERFHQFLADKHSTVWFSRMTADRKMEMPPNHRAAKTVRELCGVTSRADFSTNPDAALFWCTLEGAYQRWLLTQQYAESIR